MTLFSPFYVIMLYMSMLTIEITAPRVPPSGMTFRCVFDV